MKGYRKLRKLALDKLHAQLPKDLYYHGINHTLKVLETCNAHIKREKIPAYEAKLLRLAVLMHDIGYTESGENHEARAMDLAEEWMAIYDFPKRDIAIVKGLILATRVPQNPKNHLERIICDSDLDYLGRSDFYEISAKLYKELKVDSKVNSKKEWDKKQIKFLQEHEYHTPFARKNRQPEKEKRIVELKQMVTQAAY